MGFIWWLFILIIINILGNEAFLPIEKDKNEIQGKNTSDQIEPLRED